MNIFGIILPLLLLLISLSLAGGLLWLIFSPLFPALRGQSGSFAVRRAARNLGLIDACLAQDKPLETLRYVQKAIIFDTRISSTQLFRLKEHYQNVLSRCLVIAEDLDSSTPSLVPLEKSLMERIALIELLNRAIESYQSLRFRRERAGKDLPPWSKEDFRSRLQQIREQLKNNEQQARQSLRSLLAEIAARADNSGVTIH